MRKGIAGIGFVFALAVVCSFAAAQTHPPAQNAPHAAATYDRALLTPSLLTRRAPDVYKVKVVTTKGPFVITVTRAWAPNGADRFYNLVRHHYYDGASFFRVLNGFVAQFGLSAYPDVNKVWVNANIKDDPVKESNITGYVTFAAAGSNTRTTQVFVNLNDNSGSLDHSSFAPFAPFGQVTEGMDVVNQLYSGYGEGAPDGHGPTQDAVANKGHEYLEKNFPKLDSIKTAEIVLPAAAPTPAPKPAANPAPKPAATPAPKPPAAR
jgi:peptidyl-prolyl cis-trans isomerase A (cyclophilin A)